MRILILLLLTLLFVAMPAHARSCSEAILECGHGEVRDVHNLKVLYSAGKDANWIHKHCRPSVIEPSTCEWWLRPGSTGNSSGNVRTTVVSPNEQPYEEKPQPQPEPPVNRDNAKQGPTPAPREVLDSGIFAAEIASAAQKYKLPAQLIRAVMTVESGGNPLVLSNKGAVGLMQLLPATAKEMGVEDIHDVAQNIQGGTRFLRVLANRFDGDLVKVLSAYHAGSTRVLGRDATPFAATDDYVRKVLRIYYQLRDGR